MKLDMNPSSLFISVLSLFNKKKDANPTMKVKAPAIIKKYSHGVAILEANSLWVSASPLLPGTPNIKPNPIIKAKAIKGRIDITDSTIGLFVSSV